MLDQTNFERLTVPQPWPASEVAELFRLRSQLGWDWAAIASALGRTESAVKSKLKYELHNQRARSPFYRVAGVRDPVPDSVLNEQARRQVASSRDLAGAVFGDPPVGFSALDKRSAA